MIAFALLLSAAQNDLVPACATTLQSGLNRGLREFSVPEDSEVLLFTFTRSSRGFHKAYRRLKEKPELFEDLFSLNGAPPGYNIEGFKAISAWQTAKLSQFAELCQIAIAGKAEFVSLRVWEQGADHPLYAVCWQGPTTRRDGRGCYLEYDTFPRVSKP